MEQYISKSALVAEIKRRIKEIEEIGTYLTLTNLLCYIDTLEVKEVDLETEYDICKALAKLVGGSFSKRDFDIAKHFFELGLRSTITEEDCKLVWNIGDKIPYMPEEEFFKELLKRYKAQKGEKA